MSAIKIIEKYYQAFNRKDYPGMLEMVSDDLIHDINQGKRVQGKEQFQEFLKRMDFLYDEKLSDFEFMINQDGTRGAAEFICHGTYKNTDSGLPEARGQKYDIPVGCFFEIRGDKISRITNWYNLPDWIAMVKEG